MSKSEPSATLRDWISGARPRTLPLAFSPVILGSASAVWRDQFDFVLALLAGIVAVSLQVGVNYANDYSDGIRGTDGYRVGPQRLTGSGLAAPQAVKRAAFGAFGVSVVAGASLVSLSQSWELLIVGAIALVAAWTYTGGRSPYGYRGLGELGVFVFFGLVATMGTAYVQIGAMPWESWLTGSAVGSFASAVLLQNNLRDIEQDRQAGKITLAVSVGQSGSKVVITALLVLPFLIAAILTTVFVWVPVVFVTGILTLAVAVIVWLEQGPKDLIRALQLTTITSLVFSVALAAAIAF